MNKNLSFVLSALLVGAISGASGLAFAAKGGESGNVNCNGQGNANSPCAGTTPPETTPPVVTPVPGPQGQPGAPGRDGKDGETVVGPAGAEGKPGVPGATTYPPLPSDIVTQGQINSATQSLREQIQSTDKRASAGTAAAIGFASIPQTVEPGSSGIGAGAGCYRSECGLAIGISHRTQGGDWHIKGAVTVDSRGGAGLGVGALRTWR